MRVLLLCTFLLSLAACSQKEWIDRLASRQEQQLAIQSAEELRNGELGKLAQEIEPGLKKELPRAAAQVRPILARAQGPFAIETVNVAQMSGGPVTKAFTV